MNTTRIHCLTRLFMLLSLWLMGSLPAFALPTNETTNSNLAIRLQVDGAIGPATASYIKSGLKKAANKQAKLVIIQMDTPGGLDKSMRDIIKAILASPIPVASYVAPNGARAASAGTYILYASQIAAMAPGTNLGAATPVSLGGMPNPDKITQPEKEKSTTDKSDLSQKIKKDAAAYIRALAQLHDRNIDWAKKAVIEADSITAQQALTLGVIDIVAENIPDLLKQINGRTVKVQGKNQQLSTDSLTVESLAPDWQTKFLSVITNPSVAYILLLLGIYGLFFEFSNPGFVLPGVVGAIALLLALYALQLLPISYVGLALILLGISFMVAEALVPSFGALGIGGVIAFIVGSVMLINTDAPGYGLPWTLILSMAIVNLMIISTLVSMAVRARCREPVIGANTLLGQTGIAITDFESSGTIKIDGELWQCQSNIPVKAGDKVQVTKVIGLNLHVEPINHSS